MRQTPLLVIFVIAFLDVVGFGMLLPVLPFVTERMGGQGLAVGLLLGGYSFIQFLLSPLWGRLSDRWGRRPIILASLLGGCLSLLLLWAAGSLRWLFIARVAAGASGATLAMAHAFVIDVTSDAASRREDRSRGFGMIGAAFGLGLVFGPALGGPLSRYGDQFPMLMAAALALFNLLFALLVLEEPRLSPEARSANRYKRFDAETVRLVLDDPRMRLASGLLLFGTLAVSQAEAMLALYLNNRFQFDGESTGVLLAVMGLIAVGAHAGLAPRLLRRHGEIRVAIAGSAAASLGMAAFLGSGPSAWIVPAFCVLALGQGLLLPALARLAAAAAPARQADIAQGVYRSFGSVARILGPPLAGALFDRVSWRSPFLSAGIALAGVSVTALLWAVVPSKVSELAEAERNPYLEG